MSAVVGGFVVPHDPLMLADPDGPGPEVRDAVRAAYDEVARRFAALEPTAAVIIGADHYILFGPGCLPTVLLGIGDVDTPLERLPGLERGPVPTNPQLARSIMEFGFDHGIDWAVAKALTIDHSVAIPYQFVVRGVTDAAVIPLYLASGVEPLVRLRRAAQIGEAVRRAVDAYPGDERVVVIGSGGLSHWVGTAEMGRVDEKFDREVLGLLAAGDLDALVAMDDADITARGGNGGHEARNLVCALAAVPHPSGEVIGYHAVPEWIAGLGFMELHSGAGRG